MPSAAAAHGGILLRSAAATGELLAAPRDVGVLHGDIHHDSYFGVRGWLSIDPKSLPGKRGFDYAHLFCNPDHETAARSDSFARRVAVVTEATGLERRRLLQWILAWGGLSAAFAVEDGTPPETALEVAQMAAAALDR